MPDFYYWLIGLGAFILILIIAWMGLLKHLRNATIYRKYNHDIRRLERRLDVHLDLKTVRFRSFSPLSEIHLRRNIENLELVNRGISAFYEVCQRHDSKDKHGLIAAISALPDLVPFYDLKAYTDEGKGTAEGEILSRFVERAHSIHDPLLLSILGKKIYTRRNAHFYYAYKKCLVYVKIKKGLPEANLVDYNALEFSIERTGRTTNEGERLGTWHYHFTAFHDRMPIFNRTIHASKVNDVRHYENMMRILNEREVYADCHTIAEALKKMARIENMTQITLTAIDIMSGSQFKGWCKDALEEAYDCEVEELANDDNVDFLIQSNEKIRKTVVLVFRQEKPISSTHIKAVQNAAFVHDADSGLIITNGTFTKPARDLATGTLVTLMSRSELVNLIDKSNKKNHREVEQ